MKLRITVVEFHRDVALRVWGGEGEGKREKVHRHILVSFGFKSGDSAQMLNISSDYKTTIYWLKIFPKGESLSFSINMYFLKPVYATHYLVRE